MLRQIEYTNPYNNIKTIKTIKCSNTETYPNGNPVPVSPDEAWQVVFEKIDTAVQSFYVLLP